MLRFCFAREKMNPDLAPRQRTGDCLWIHTPHWGPEAPLSSHQTFLHEVELRQCVFCKKPWLFWFSSRRRNFGLSESEFKQCATSILLPLLQHVPSLIPEKCVRVWTTLCLPDYLWNPLTRTEDLPTDHPHPSCHPSFYFGFGFSGIPAPVSWWLVRHFAQILNLKMSSMQPCFQMLGLLLVSTIPVVAMHGTNCFQNWQITVERQEERNCR